jgi:hypothetical protein
MHVNAYSVRFTIGCYCVGLVTKIFSVFDVGLYSITVEIIAHCFMFYALILGRKKLSLSNPITFFVGIIIFQGILVSILRNNIDGSTVTSVIQILFSFLIFSFFATFDKSNVYYFRKVIGVLGFVVACIAIYQVLARPFGWQFSYLEITNQQMGSIDGFQRTVGHRGVGYFELLRVSSLFAEPGDLAKFMLICLCVTNLFRINKWKYISEVILIITIVISQSVGGYVILILLLPLLYSFSKQFLVAALIIVLLILAISYELGIDIFINRIDGIISGTAFSDSQRFLFIGEALNRISLVVFFGAGIGNADIIFGDIVVANFWLNFTGEFGISGLILFLSVFAYYGFKVRRLPEAWIKIWFFVEFIALFWKPGLLYSSTIFAVFGLIHALEIIHKKNKLTLDSPSKNISIH